MKPGKREEAIQRIFTIGRKYPWGLGEGRRWDFQNAELLTAVLCTVLLPWKEMDLVGTKAKGASHPADAAPLEGNHMATTRTAKKGQRLG